MLIFPPRFRKFVICWRSFLGGMFMISPLKKIVSTCMRFPEETADVRLEAKFPNLDQRLNPVLPRIRIGSTVNLQPFAVHVDSVRDPHVEFGEFDAALESGGKCFDDTFAENRFRAQDYDSNGRWRSSAR